MPNYAQAAIQIRQNKERRAKDKELLRSKNLGDSFISRAERDRERDYREQTQKVSTKYSLLLIEYFLLSLYY